MEPNPGIKLHETPTGELEFRDGALHQEHSVVEMWNDGRVIDRRMEWKPVRSV